MTQSHGNVNVGNITAYMQCGNVFIHVCHHVVKFETGAMNRLVMIIT